MDIATKQRYYNISILISLLIFNLNKFILEQQARGNSVKEKISETVEDWGGTSLRREVLILFEAYKPGQRVLPVYLSLYIS